VDPEPISLRDQEQFRIEEPPVVVDQRQQRHRRVTLDRLEAACDIGNCAPQYRS